MPAASRVLLFALAVVCLAAGVPQPDWRAKVDPRLLSGSVSDAPAFQGDGVADFLVVLEEQADLSPAARLRTKPEKGQRVFEILTATAGRTQAPLLEQLRSLGVEHRAFWIVNMVHVRGGPAAVEAMARRPEVSHVLYDPPLPMEGPVAREPAPPNPVQAVEWNVSLIGAPSVWSQGITGQGVVVAGQDTGYSWSHAALRNQYRGWNGASANHGFNWHDAIHSGGGVCGSNSLQPCDDHGHGTHTLGSAVGDDGLTNQIGVAPGARWIGCRSMDQGNGTQASYTECYQWFAAPTDLAGQNPDPALAPHVINNSWACPGFEGCTDLSVMQAVVANVRAAGILVVSSAGNSGPACESVFYPSAIYHEAFSVGATTSTDSIVSFSSRGPVTVDGSGRLKPDVVAPGSGIRSSVPGGGYSLMSGTSMAAPHVAGLAALMISANPALAGRVTELEILIEQHAVPLTSAQTCGGVPGSRVPNHTFGWGRIDAAAAVAAAQSLIFADGFEHGAVRENWTLVVEE